MHLRSNRGLDSVVEVSGHLLLHSATTYSFPFGILHGGNGLPVANNALPSVQSFASFGSTSANRLGFDNGKIIGRSVPLAISLTTSSVKAPLWVEHPTSTVGFTSLIASNNPTWPSEFRMLTHSSSGRVNSLSSGRIFEGPNEVLIRPYRSISQNRLFASSMEVSSIRTIASRI